MNGFTIFLLISTSLAGITTAIYWFSRRRRPPVYTLILLICGLVIVSASAILDRPEYSFEIDPAPLSIIVAFDMSPSMLAVPDPTEYPNIPARHIRVKSVLQKVFAGLEERQDLVNVSLIGFTKNAEILMGWDNNTSQLHEILKFGLSPELFTNSGTNIEAAVESIVRLFDMLPEETKDANRKIVFIVSDGEDTTSQETLGYAIDELSSQAFHVISLHVGLIGINEGVPRYDQTGEFSGFEAMSGNTYSTPNIETMLSLSRSSSLPGLYVHAEDDDAVERILGSMLDSRLADAAFSSLTLRVLGLFCITALVCVRVL